MKGSDKPTCGDHGGRRNNGQPCERVEGWGMPEEYDGGRCSWHAGTDGEGSHESNQNRTTHSLHARKVNAVYQKVFSEDIQDLVDDIYSDYLEDYQERHGSPRTGDKAELFRIAVSYGKHVHSEEWAIDKPSELESGNAFVDKETRKKPTEGGLIEEREYKQTVVQKGQQSLSQDRRMWLKDLGLLDDPESQKATGIQDLADAWPSELDKADN